VPLVASAGNGAADCTLGAGPGKHCIGNTNTGMACTADANCGRGAGTCALDANRFFGPPLPIVNAGLSTCVVNGIQTDGSGTLTSASGDAVLGIKVSSRVYLTGNSASPRPTRVSGSCSYGPPTSPTAPSSKAFVAGVPPIPDDWEPPTISARRG